MISSEHGVWESCKMSSTGGERKRGQSGEFASRVKAIVSNYPFTPSHANLAKRTILCLVCSDSLHEHSYPCEYDQDGPPLRVAAPMPSERHASRGCGGPAREGLRQSRHDSVAAGAARLAPRLGAGARGAQFAGQEPEGNREGQERGRIVSMSATMPTAALAALWSAVRETAARSVRAAERSG